MLKRNLFIGVWYANFLGIGYGLNNGKWSVFPIFTNLANAKEIWDKEIEPLDEKSLRMRFIETDGEYEFILYPYPYSELKPNFGLYRSSMDISRYYSTFKQKSGGEAIFTFAVLGTGQKPIVFDKSKLVTDVKFMKSSEVIEYSPEWVARDVQKRAKAKN